MIRSAIPPLFVLLLTVAPSQAGMVISVEQMVNPGSNFAPYGGFAYNAFTTDTGFNSGTSQSTWVSYALGVIPSGGEKVTTFDISITIPANAGSGLAQRWTLDADDPSIPSEPTPKSTAVNTADSHLIVNGSIQFVVPQENKLNGVGPAVPVDTATRDYGVGSSMTGAWGFTPTEQATQQDGVPVRFAYIVVPRGFWLTPQNFILTANVAGSQTAAGYHFTQSQFSSTLPLTPPVSIADKNLGDILAGSAVSTTLLHAPTSLAWNLASFTGPNGAVAGATLDPTTGAFNWNSSGAALGNYQAVINGYSSVYNETDSGLLSFNLVVPEPTTLALYSLAVFGLIIERRR